MSLISTQELTERQLFVEAHEQIAPLSVEWNALAGELPFRRVEWLEPWWEHYRTASDRLLLLAVRDAEQRLIGLAPWYLRNSFREGRVVRFLGSGRVCSDYLTLLAVPDAEQRVASAVADWLMTHQQYWDALELDGVPVGDAAIEHLCELFARQQHRLHRQEGLACWRVALPEAWEAYLKQLSKSRRERVRQVGRRVFDAGRGVVRVATTQSEFMQGFTVLMDLHQRRRESLGQRGCFASQRFTNFLRDAGERFLKRGRLRLQWVELEGAPVAVEFDLLGDDTVYYYQSGMDPGRLNDRPGWLGAIAALRWAIEEGYTAFDFLRGDEAYKAHWRAEAVATLEVRIAATHSRALCRDSLWSSRMAVKSWLKSWLRSPHQEDQG